jgi:putative flippase GtrA
MTPQFFRFLVAGGIAACVNFGSRFALSLALPYPAAICLAYLAGMVTAFLLNRQFVFPEGNESTTRQALWFTAVNALALLQTLAISLLLARWVLPAIGWPLDVEASAHAVGVAVPIVTSYFGHRHLSFRRR